MNAPETGVKRFDDYVIDSRKRLLSRDGEPLPLMPKAFDLLNYMVENAGRVLEKDELLSAVWPDTLVEESNLSLNISILRKALGEKPAENRYIATVPGRGYKFVAEVQSGSNGDAAAREGSTEATLDSPPVAAHPRWKYYAAFGAVAVAAAAAFAWFSLSPGETGGGKIRSIAVLPFKPLVKDQRDEALELGMADTLISKLADSGELIVRPISSVRRFDSIDQDALEAGRQLGVEAVLEGSIQRTEEKIRVNVRLLRTADGSSIWNATYDEQMADIFVLQDSISRRAAEALRIRLGGRPPYTSNLEAYQLYMLGRLQVLKATRPEVLAGIDNFRRAIDLDSNYALAHVGLADAYRTLSLGGEMRPLEVLPQAKVAALRAAELDDSLAEAHTVLAYALFWCDWNWADSEAHFRRALELNPNSADAYSEYAFLLSNLGRHEEALAAIRRALELDPLNVRTNARYGQFLNHAGRTDEALVILARTTELDPDYWLAYQFATSVHLVRGEYSEALAAAETTKRLNRESTRPYAYGGYAKAKLGDREGAKEDLDALLAAATERYVPNVNIAVLQLALGDREGALASLQRAAVEKDPWMTFLKVEPIWFELNGDPRFESIRRSMGL
jgi:DNA-binding winged helix-turn-helix (wHTH) protein/TolB-like protein/Flp pilus assembly protein TadD